MPRCCETARNCKRLVRDCVTRPPTNPIPANFHLSSGATGAPQRQEALHELGELLYSRFAQAVGEQLSPDQVNAEPSLRRIARIHSGEQPVKVDMVSGMCYQAHSKLDHHQDGPMPLCTMSVALGDACDFVIGGKPLRSFKNLRVGAARTLRMESGDALYFDAGSVPHGIPTIHKGSAPAWYRSVREQGFQGARVSVLFREADGWDSKYLSH